MIEKFNFRGILNLDVTNGPVPGSEHFLNTDPYPSKTSGSDLNIRIRAKHPDPTKIAGSGSAALVPQLYAY